MDKKILFFGCAFLLVIAGLVFVFAASTATDLIIEDNVTSLYDEGIFTVNWTAGGDVAANYTIHLWMNDNYVSAEPNGNTSETGYAWSNTTEANYTFTIEAVNATGYGTNSTTNVSIVVDSDGPVITLPEYTNGTAKKNTAQLTLNISLSDVAATNAAGSHCLVDVNGTSNQTIVASGGWCNSSSINLTGTEDGNSTLNIWANNSAGLWNLTSKYVVQIDTTAPTLSLSESSSSTSSITVSKSCNDATSGVTSGSCTISTSSGSVSGSTISGLSCGNSYTVTLNATDNAGNTASASTSMTTSSCGGGTVPTYEWTFQKKHSWTKITPGVAAIMKDFDREIGIKQISIKVNNEAQNVRITVEKYDGKPANVSVEKTGKIYNYLHINAENLEQNLEKATIRTQIAKSWVSGNNLEKENIALFKFDETAGKWNELITSYAEEDDAYYYYDSEVGSFSYFAISEKVVIDSGEDGIGEDGEDEELEKKGLGWWWIVIIAGVIAIAYLIFVKFFKKR